ncbi:MAG TPA: hypothetical protein VEA17_11180 [Bordetella sp.]|nr:hypothetical protein [Bordetella sp.]
MQFDSSTTNTALLSNHQEGTQQIPVETISHAGSDPWKKRIFFHNTLIDKEPAAYAAGRSGRGRRDGKTLIVLKSVIRKQKLTVGRPTGDKAAIKAECPRKKA